MRYLAGLMNAERDRSRDYNDIVRDDSLADLEARLLRLERAVEELGERVREIEERGGTQ